MKQKVKTMETREREQHSPGLVFQNNKPSSLKISDPNDVQEAEADRVADKAMLMPEVHSATPEVTPVAEPLMHSKQVDNEPSVMMQIEEENDSDTIQMKPEIQKQGISGDPNDDNSDNSNNHYDIQLKSTSSHGSLYASQNIHNKLNSTSGNGESLPPLVQREMQSKMGQDFSGVRIHNDSRANDMSTELHAKAFTHGNDIYFKSGEYNPVSSGGKRLLAHELAHTVQQGKSEKELQRVVYHDDSSIPVVLNISIEIISNLLNDEGSIIGMRGTQRINYTNEHGRVITENYEIRWEEDEIIENQQYPYEFPPNPETFEIYEGTRTRFPVQTRHSETGVAIHELGNGRSEGCIIASEEIIRDLLRRIRAEQSNLHGRISQVVDSRNEQDQQTAPLPYSSGNQERRSSRRSTRLSLENQLLIRQLRFNRPIFERQEFSGTLLSFPLSLGSFGTINFNLNGAINLSSYLRGSIGALMLRNINFAHHRNTGEDEGSSVSEANAQIYCPSRLESGLNVGAELELAASYLGLLEFISINGEFNSNARARISGNFIQDYTLQYNHGNEHPWRLNIPVNIPLELLFDIHYNGDIGLNLFQRRVWYANLFDDSISFLWNGQLQISEDLRSIRFIQEGIEPQTESGEEANTETERSNPPERPEINMSSMSMLAIQTVSGSSINFNPLQGWDFLRDLYDIISSIDDPDIELERNLGMQFPENSDIHRLSNFGNQNLNTELIYNVMFSRRRYRQGIQNQSCAASTYGFMTNYACFELLIGNDRQTITNRSSRRIHSEEKILADTISRSGVSGITQSNIYQRIEDDITIVDGITIIQVFTERIPCSEKCLPILESILNHQVEIGKPEFPVYYLIDHYEPTFSDEEDLCIIYQGELNE